jgi:hypothetical protein
MTVVIFRLPALVLNSSTLRAAKAGTLRMQPRTINDVFIAHLTGTFKIDDLAGLKQQR